MNEPERESTAELADIVHDLVAALARGRSADNPALLEELNDLRNRLQKHRS
ncbi:hypothetical protein ABIE44_000965 [Marmoricola sp. OAE513]|uniref:hypothetical protein n=1 Tax=Marmoricola sp. OAE513 TaxID=2817894 RepID=UPI001AE2BA27